MDVKKVGQIVRKLVAEKGTRKTEMCVDCVAYAPHRRVDVRDWDVDYAFFSYYKVGTYFKSLRSPALSHPRV